MLAFLDNRGERFAFLAGEVCKGLTGKAGELDCKGVEAFAYIRFLADGIQLRGQLVDNDLRHADRGNPIRIRPAPRSPLTSPRRSEYPARRRILGGASRFVSAAARTRNWLAADKWRDKVDVRRIQPLSCRDSTGHAHVRLLRQSHAVRCAWLRGRCVGGVCFGS